MKKNKTKNKQKHVKKSKAKKTRLTQNTGKTHKLCKNKNAKREKKVIESLGAFFLPHLGRTFPLIKPMNWL